jgi:pimeloyl-ACP methyl ester carboxylesterase
LDLIEGPTGPLEVLVNGAGDPTTLFAHGLAGSIAETRPFGSGVVGTRVFMHFRGHGRSSAPGLAFSYAELADELLVVQRRYGATRGLGVSLGAGAVLRAAISHPETFERLVVMLPATVDRARTGVAVDRVDAMASMAEAGDVDGLTTLLLAEQPAELAERRVVKMWVRQQAERFLVPELTNVMREVPASYPVDETAELDRLTMPVLVVGQDGDEAHPSWLARELAEALPNATLEIFPPGGVVWTHRARLREIVTTFLNP